MKLTMEHLEHEHREQPLALVLMGWWQAHLDAGEPEIRAAIHKSAKMTGLCVIKEGLIEIDRSELKPNLIITGWGFAVVDA